MKIDNKEIQFLKDAIVKSKNKCKEGQVTKYLPELANVPHDILGITVCPLGQKPVSAGDYKNLFTIQSISKVFTLILALMDHGVERIFDKVGMEPSGENFNSMIKLERHELSKPFNPMINSGAITISSMIEGNSPKHKFDRILAFIRMLAADDSIDYNQSIFESETIAADRNRSIGYLLKQNKVIEGEVDDHLEVYFKQCSIEVTCTHLARMALVLAQHGVDPDSGKQLIPQRYVQIAKVFMTTCGMYNTSGEFAIKVGIPAKSGVSGCIMGLVPGKMGIGVFGPALNERGNSIAGIDLLEQLSERWNLTIH